jgi:predicted HicB family RNase H-like nuclease
MVMILEKDYKDIGVISMAIAPKPKNQLKNLAPEERAAEEFIAGAGKRSVPPETEKASKKKIGFMVYFDPEVLAKVELMAKRHGLSRSSWIQLKAIEALEQDEHR